jgi:hypothetical protein
VAFSYWKHKLNHCDPVTDPDAIFNKGKKKPSSHAPCNQTMTTP